MAAELVMMGYVEAAALLKKHGIELAPARLVKTAVSAAAAADELGYPVALKAISPELTHKSDSGLVLLGLETAVTVKAAADILLAECENVVLDGLLVQKMMPSGVEMIIGVHSDPQFGPVIALGSGGVLVELLADAVLRLPPITTHQAMDMIKQTKAWKLLQGYRHYPPADVAALAQLLVQVSQMVVEENGRIAGLDLNPVIVLPEGEGVGVVDLRVVENNTDGRDLGQKE